MEATAISAIAALIGVVLGRALDRGHWLRGQKLEAYVNLMQLSSLIHSRLKSEPPQDVTLEQLEISDPLFEQFDRARAAAFAVASHELITPINDIVRILRLVVEEDLDVGAFREYSSSLGFALKLDIERKASIRLRRVARKMAKDYGQTSSAIDQIVG